MQAVMFDFFFSLSFKSCFLLNVYVRSLFSFIFFFYILVQLTCCKIPYSLIEVHYLMYMYALYVRFGEKNVVFQGLRCSNLRLKWTYWLISFLWSLVFSSFSITNSGPSHNKKTTEMKSKVIKINQYSNRCKPFHQKNTMFGVNCLP